MAIHHRHAEWSLCCLLLPGRDTIVHDDVSVVCGRAGCGGSALLPRVHDQLLKCQFIAAGECRVRTAYRAVHVVVAASVANWPESSERHLQRCAVCVCGAGIRYHLPQPQPCGVRCGRFDLVAVFESDGVDVDGRHQFIKRELRQQRLRAVVVVLSERPVKRGLPLRRLASGLRALAGVRQ